MLPDELRNVPSLAYLRGELASASNEMAPGTAEAVLLDALLTSSLDCVKLISRQGLVLYMNAPGMCAMDVEDFETVRGRPWLDLWPEAAREGLSTALKTALAGVPNQIEAAGTTLRGRPRHWRITLTPLRGADRVEAALIVSRDVTEIMDAELRAREFEHDAEIAFGETRHRATNVFALMPALVRLSARTAQSVPALVDGLHTRIAALHRAHGLTFGAGARTEGVALDALARAVLAPFVAEDAIDLSGPDLRIAGGDANAVGLILHELATNAAKHGALSAPAGRVRVAWSQDADAVTVVWTENGGPAAEPHTPDQPAGFGTALLDRLVKSRSGAVSRRWGQDGLTVSLSLPR